MSVTGTSLNINSGNLLFNNDSKYSCISQSYNIKSNSTYLLNASNNININTSSGNYGVNVNSHTTSTVQIYCTENGITADKGIVSVIVFSN